MVSTFGWLDTDRAQSQQMLAIVDLFKEQNTLDDLGIGQVRDALSDLLFPGSSTIQTRLRYALFIPWLLREAANERTAKQMHERMRNLEFRLIEALRNGDAGNGIIGVDAGPDLKRLPSSVYWAMLGSWGIRTHNFSQGEFFTRREHAANLAKNTPASDDKESRGLRIADGIDDGLPPSPEDFLDQVDFRLTPAEAGYLTDKITAHHPGTLLAWLVHNPPIHTSVMDTRLPWELDHCETAPVHLRVQLDHARRFHHAIRGASLLYNLLLARTAKRTELEESYELEMGEWEAQLREAAIMADWDRSEFWGIVKGQSRISGPTQKFIDRWLDILAGGGDLLTDRGAHALVIAREKDLKGPRARFTNAAALDRWNGRVGLGVLDYRWGYVSTLLTDLYDGRAA